MGITLGTCSRNFIFNVRILRVSPLQLCPLSNVSPHVYLQVTAQGKSTVASRAGKRALTAVSERVTFQRVRSSKRPAAQTAAVATFIGVTAPVSRQIAAARKRPLAHVAGERSFAAMRIQVTFQSIRPRKLSAAYHTRVLSSIVIRPSMIAVAAVVGQ